MLNIKERAGHYKMFAFVGDDTFDVLAERCRTLVESGRRMTVLTRYEGNDHTPDIKTGLRLDNDPQHAFPDLRTHGHDGTQTFEVRLKPGINGFGFACHPGDGSEVDAAKRFRSQPRQYGPTATTVEVTGGVDGGGIGAEDRIEIRHRNSHGVISHTVVVFDHVEARDVAETRAQLIDHLAAYADAKGPLSAGTLCTLADKIRDTWRSLDEVLDVSGPPTD